MTSVASALITTTQKRSFAAARLQNASASLASLRVASSNGNDRSLNSAASSTLTPLLPLPLLTPSPVPARSLHCAASGSIGDAKYPRSVPAWTTPLGAYPRRASITLHACWNAPSARRILPRSPSGRIAGDASATTHRSVEKSALARGSGRDRESCDDRVSCPPSPPPSPPLTRRVALRVAIPGVVGSERDRGERGGDDDDDGAFGGVGARRHVARARANVESEEAELRLAEERAEWQRDGRARPSPRRGRRVRRERGHARRRRRDATRRGGRRRGGRGRRRAARRDGGASWSASLVVLRENSSSALFIWHPENKEAGVAILSEHRPAAVVAPSGFDVTSDVARVLRVVRPAS